MPGWRKERRERELNDLRAVLSTREGRRFVWRLMERGGPFQSPFDTNALVMARLAGAKETALALFHEVCKVDPGAFVLMQAEAEAQRIEDEQRGS